jgi:GT2 family glycosyltransferase
MSATRVLVVTPAYLARPAEPGQLLRCARAVLAQPGVDALIVVDDGSPLPLPALPERAELLRLPANRGPAAARNAGLERALERGATLVLMTDVDCVPEPGWAAALAAHLDGSGDVAAGGVTRSLGDTLLDRYHDFTGALNGRWILPERTALLYAPTCNIALRAEALGAVRFDERFPTAAGEDYDFCHRLRAAGPIGFVPTAVVRHDFAYGSTWRGLPAFVRLFRRYGEADPLLWEKHPDLRHLRSEACAAADVLAEALPADPAAYRRAALSRLEPRRLRLAMALLRQLSRRAYKQGQAAPRAWRTVAAPPLAGGGSGM